MLLKKLITLDLNLEGNYENNVKDIEGNYGNNVKDIEGNCGNNVRGIKRAIVAIQLKTLKSVGLQL